MIGISVDKGDNVLSEFVTVAEKLIAMGTNFAFVAVIDDVTGV